MKNTYKLINFLPVALIIAGGVSLLCLLLVQGRGADISPRLPVVENRAGSSNDVPFTGELTMSDGKPSALPGSWPGFRGADLDAIITEELSGPLNLQWETHKPKSLWEVELGEGYAGAAVANGRVYVLDYDQEKKGDAIRCLSLDDGREITDVTAFNAEKIELPDEFARSRIAAIRLHASPTPP